MSAEEREAAGIENLPGNLFEALDEFKKDPLAIDTLGDHIFEKYIEAKEKEWDEYRTQVTQWELDEYLFRY